MKALTDSDLVIFSAALSSPRTQNCPELSFSRKFANHLYAKNEKSFLPSTPPKEHHTLKFLFSDQRRDIVT